MPLAPHQKARLQATAACGGGLLLWWRVGGVAAAGFAGLTAALALVAWTSPARYAPVQRALDRVIHGLLAALTWVLLGFIYLVVFAPMRLWRHLRGFDPLHRRPDLAAASYLQPLPPAAPDRFDRQF
ncbi:MAG TPA: hypothetical protein VG936_08915 [Lacunisphaera sp.]|nr:hypothetical protein [Lacunisphaera sp.]